MWPTRKTASYGKSRAGHVSILAGTAGVFGSAEGTGPSVQFSGPQGVAVDSSGNVYVADTGNSTIRKLTSGGAPAPWPDRPATPATRTAPGTNRAI